MKLAIKTKLEDAKALQDIQSKTNNLPLKGVPGKNSFVSETPGSGWTLQIYDVTETEDGKFSYPVDADVEDSDKLTKAEKALWASAKLEAVDAAEIPK